MGKTIRASRLFYIHEYGYQPLFLGLLLACDKKKEIFEKGILFLITISYFTNNDLPRSASF